MVLSAIFICNRRLLTHIYLSGASMGDDLLDLLDSATH